MKKFIIFQNPSKNVNAMAVQIQISRVCLILCKIFALFCRSRPSRRPNAALLIVRAVVSRQGPLSEVWVITPGYLYVSPSTAAIL